MIENWDYRNLNMDFSSMYKGSNHPSDIDMFYLGRDNTLIIGEIKNEHGTLKDGQRRLLAELVQGWKYDAVAVYITHDKLYQNGDRKVDVPSCKVRELYLKSEKIWRQPKKLITVQDVLDWYGEERS